MKTQTILILFLLIATSAIAQVVTSNPSLPTESDKVIITFNAAEGSKGLKDYSGDIWAHTGLITDKSTSNSDWKYVKASWGQNTDACKLKRVSGSLNLYTLELTPSIKEFYGVPNGETVKKMAFVFRNNNGSKEGKGTGNSDIFVDVVENNLAVSFVQPLNNSIHPKGSNVLIELSAIQNDLLELFVNDTKVKESSSSSLQFTLTNVNNDEIVLKAKAHKGSAMVEELITIFTRGNVVLQKRPVNLKRGINVISDTEATVLLFAPEKEFVYLVGDFNNWIPTNSNLMKKDGDYFWLTLSDLNPNLEYAYQFWFDGDLKIADPYTNKVLDPWNDKYIPYEVYPNLKSYPEDKTEEIVSVFSTKTDAYNWKVNEFAVSNPEQLVIYELLIRDFTENGDIKTITDSINYFKRLGVNAIELMPFNEFEGNDSWGYNPSFYFAVDKAYGTPNDYKEFIDVCHKNGIAVIMDMVLNHSFGQSPFARMYLEDGKPAANNPWYNRNHNMAEPAAQWGFDFNHESVHTKALVDSICAFWLEEYKIDGFRFDFTKGFTNTLYGVGDWASAYDASRIDILKRLSNEIWKRKADAIVSFEHLSDNSEEKVLAEHGVLLWGNHNYNFNEATMGYTENNKSDFSWASYKQRNWSKPHIINYMESHDEERIMYKNKMYGATQGAYNVKDIPTALERSGAAAVFLMSIPGPKMIWQFGELGYDYSINTCENGSTDEGCRTGSKPIKWDYQTNEDRLQLFNTYAKIIQLKRTEPVFASSDFSLTVEGTLKRIELNSDEKDVRLIGNFGLETKEISVNYSSTGWWYNPFTGDSISVSNTNNVYSLKAGEFVMLSSKKLKGFPLNTQSISSVEKVVIAPNPANDVLRISAPNAAFKTLNILNFKGQIVYSKRVLNTSEAYNISELKSGLYIVQLISENKVPQVYKLIKK